MNAVFNVLLKNLKNIFSTTNKMLHYCITYLNYCISSLIYQTYPEIISSIFLIIINIFLINLYFDLIVFSV